MASQGARERWTAWEAGSDADIAPCKRIAEESLVCGTGTCIILCNDPCGPPGGSDRKGPACSAGDLGSISGSGRSSGEGNSNPLQPVFLAGESPGQRSLAVCSPWSHRVRQDWATNPELNGVTCMGTECVCVMDSLGCTAESNTAL